MLRNGVLLLLNDHRGEALPCIDGKASLLHKPKGIR